MPSDLDFEANQQRTMIFLHNLRFKTSRPVVSGMKQPSSRFKSRVGRIGSYSDFTKLRSISPGAALVLAAEYDRMRRVSNVPAAALDLERWAPNVYATLMQLGFFELLGFSSSKLLNGPAEDPDPSLHIAPMQMGDDVNLTQAEDPLLKLFQEAGGNDELRVQLLGAVVDAIENVKGHAYASMPAASLRLIPPLWWLSGSADRSSKKLTLSIYDQGMTIPFTLPTHWSPRDIRSTIRSLFQRDFDPGTSRDGEVIRAAMELSATATGKHERGKGLAKIRQVVARCPGGRLKLISRNGIYTYADGREIVETLEVPLLGTFVEIEACFDVGGME